MNKHFETISTWCKVLAAKNQRAIWYEDGGFKYADIYEDGKGWASYSCNTREEWELLTEGIKKIPS